MRGRLAPAVAFAAFLASDGVAHALEYQLPPDPIAPTSASQCQALYEQYAAIANELFDRAKAAGRLSWEVLIHAGYNSEVHTLEAEANRLFNEAFEITSEGSRARLRCMRQVYAYQASQSHGIDGADQGVASSGRKYLSDLGGPVAEASALNGFRTLQALRVVPAGVGALGDTLGKMADIGNMLAALEGRGGPEADLNQTVGGVAAIEQWGALRSFMVKTALGEFFNINKAATSAWQAEMSAFDRDSGLGPLVSDARDAENTRFAGLAPAASLRVSDNLANDELQAYRENQGMYAGRGKAYDRALAEVQHEYKAELSRPPVPQPDQTSGQTNQTSGSAKYTALQCSQILEAIEGYKRPEYQAFGTEFVENAQKLIKYYQQLYDSGCR